MTGPARHRPAALRPGAASIRPDPAADRAALVLQGVAMRRGARWLFSGVDLVLHPGERVWLQGANGGGKSTLLRVAAGLASPHAGSVRWGGAAHERLWLGHRDGLDGRLDAAENLAWWAGLRGRAPDAAALHAALAAFGLDDAGTRRCPSRHLSAGQARRAALARLAIDPAARLWILDEPFDGLDDDGCDRLQAVLAAHLDGGGAVLMSSHRPLVRRPTGDRALRLAPRPACPTPGTAPALSAMPPGGAPAAGARAAAAPVAMAPAVATPPWSAAGAGPGAAPADPLATAVRAIARRESLGLRRQGASLLRPAAGFALAGCLCPLALGPDPQVLAPATMGLVWACALLAMLAAAPALHEADHADGTLEQLAASPAPLALHAGLRAALTGVAQALPIALGAPVLALMLHGGLDAAALAALAVGLLLGLPVVAGLGGLAAALTLGLAQPGWLVALVVLPLAVPVLVFGAGAAQAAAQGLPAAPHLALLAACALLVAPLLPAATAAALRAALE